LQGDRGEELDSIQYLLNTTLDIGKPEGEHQPFTVELGGYRDGLHGLRLSLLMAYYEWRKYVLLSRLWRQKAQPR